MFLGYLAFQVVLLDTAVKRLSQQVIAKGCLGPTPLQAFVVMHSSVSEGLLGLGGPLAIAALLGCSVTPGRNLYTFWA